MRVDNIFRAMHCMKGRVAELTTSLSTVDIVKSKGLTETMLSRVTFASKPVRLQAVIPEKFDGLSKRIWREFPLSRKRKHFVQTVLIAERQNGLIVASLGASTDSQGDTDEELAEPTFGAGHSEHPHQRDAYGKLVSAIGLIMGTAVGPGILGLPAATLPAGLQASSIMILFAWAYVTASILLVAELSCAVMAEKGQEEVSFTGLVSHTLGYHGACAAAVIYASLNYALLVACIAGLGSIIQAWLSLPLSVPFLSAASAAVVGMVVALAPFKFVDGVNRGLCGLMITAITSLVGFGIFAGRELWSAHQYHNNVIPVSSVLQAVPVTVLTLGFHVITPVVCRVVGGKPEAARRAILVGGAIPLAMVLAWNAVVLGLAPPNSTALDPIKLLLSVAKSAAPFVQAFAFSALGTTLIGYALSFPKQLGDAFHLLSQKNVFEIVAVKGEKTVENGETSTLNLEPLIWALAPPTAVAVFWPTAFASSLDFAGVYANCFLFGVLPPVMAWIYRYRRVTEDSTPPTKHKPLLPGGKIPLLVLLGISMLLAIRPGLGRG
ncbi:unnamed protein product [Calypogeia fissa]